MSTYGTILNYAFSRSSKLTRSTSGPGALIDEATEGVAIINRSISGIWTFGVSVNPEWFSYEDAPDVISPTVSAYWERPAAAFSVYLVELAGEPLRVGRVDERSKFLAKPSIYQMGRRYYPCGSSPDPTQDDLDFFYALFPVLGSSTSDPVDPVLPSHFDDLLANEVAVRMLLKDGRIEEAQAVAADRNQGLQLFAGFLAQETTGLVEFAEKDSRSKQWNVSGLALPPTEEVQGAVV